MRASPARPGPHPRSDRGPPALMHRTGSHPRGIVGILVPAGDRHQLLPQQLDQLGPHLARLPRVFKTIGQRLGHPQLAVRRFQQNRSAVGTCLTLIETGYDWLRKISGNSKHCVVACSVKQKPPCFVQTRFTTEFCHQEAFHASKNMNFLGKGRAVMQL